jgi:SnoaL-like domain
VVTEATGSHVDAGFVEAFADRWSAAWDSHEPERILELCTDDIRWYDPVLPEPIQGKEAVREFLVTTLRGFPDAKFTPIGAPYLSVDGQAAALHWRVEGAMLGPVDPPGLAPTGGRVEGEGVDLYRFRGQLVSEYTTAYDLSAWMRAMGLLPEPGSRMERVGLFFQRRGAGRLRRRNARG